MIDLIPNGFDHSNESFQLAKAVEAAGATDHQYRIAGTRRAIFLLTIQTSVRRRPLHGSRKKDDGSGGTIRLIAPPTGINTPEVAERFLVDRLR